MIKLEKTQVRIISVLIALVFIGSVVAIGVSQYGSGVASAASSSNVGVVDQGEIFTKSPDYTEAASEFQQFVSDTQKEFNDKSANMSDQEKSSYGQQMQQRIQQKEQDLMEPIQKKIEENVKSVAEAKGLTVVLDKRTVVYGGQDITQDVIKKMAK